jgi:hypothetical protein
MFLREAEEVDEDCPAFTLFADSTRIVARDLAFAAFSL